MTFQAGALDNYADAYALTRDAKWLTCARALRGYIDRFLTSPEGGFYATQDADLNAHDRTKPFVDGHEYYVLDDAHRRALGVPRVDAHEYGRENGLAIAAYVTLAQATNDPTALATATRARAANPRRRTRPRARRDRARRGSEGERASPLGQCPVRARAHAALRGDEEARSGSTAHEDRRLHDARAGRSEDGGGFFGSTLDPDAVGVFAARRKPFEDNVTAIRFFARVARATKDEKYEAVIASALRAIVTPDAIAARGRMIGDLLLALDETRCAATARSR